MTQLQTQTANKRSKSVEVESATKGSESSAKRAKVVRESEYCLGTPLIAAYSVLLAKHNEFKNCFEALMFKDQCIMSLAEEAKELRAKVADLYKSNALAKSNLSKGRSKKRPSVAEKGVIAL